jgi:hypothetical protein
MLQCREVTQLLATDAWRDAPLARRAALALHLAMCRYCRGYALTLRRLGARVRRLYRAITVEAVVERRLLDAVRRAATGTATP